MTSGSGFVITPLVVVHIVCAALVATFLLAMAVLVALLYRRSRAMPMRTVARHGMMTVLMLFVLTQGYLLMSAAATDENTTFQLDMIRYATYTVASTILVRFLASLAGMHRQLRKLLNYGLIYVYATLTIAVSVPQLIIQLLSYGSALFVFHALCWLIMRWTRWAAASRTHVAVFMALYVCVIAHFLIWLGRVFYLFATDRGTKVSATAATANNDIVSALLYLVIDVGMFFAVPVVLMFFAWWSLEQETADDNNQCWSSGSSQSTSTNGRSYATVEMSSMASLSDVGDSVDDDDGQAMRFHPDVGDGTLPRVFALPLDDDRDAAAASRRHGRHFGRPPLPTLATLAAAATASQ